MSSADQAVQVHQLRIWIRKISPQIWRRLLVRSDSTIAELHDILQIAFGWSNDHLHRFLIRGKPYGVGRSGGMSFDDNPYQIRLRDFHFRWKEVWVYEYDLTDWWQHEIRLEEVLPLDPTKRYPICVAGKRRGPIVIWRKICQEIWEHCYFHSSVSSSVDSISELHSFLVQCGGQSGMARATSKWM